ncbi:MAG: hypothetical protein ACMUIG_09085 [Thermoplasmatota archaeon]
MEETANSDRLEDVKRTRTGMILLASGIGAQILGIFLMVPPIDLLGLLVTLAGYASMAVGIVFIYRGRGGFPGKHQKLTTLSLFLLIIALAILLRIKLINSGLTFVDPMDWNYKDRVPGSDLSGDIANIRVYYWVTILPTILGAAALSMLLWHISSGKGRIVLVIYLAMALMAPVGEAALMNVTNRELEKEIDDNRIYGEEEIDELRDDLKLKQYPVGIMGLAHLLLILLASILSLHHIKEKEKEAYIGI